jgi:hypothetical protein
MKAWTSSAEMESQEQGQFDEEVEFVARMRPGGRGLIAL